MSEATLTPTGLNIIDHVNELIAAVGKEETGRYFCHMLTKDTSYTCSDETKSYLRRWGAEVRQAIDPAPVSPLLSYAAEKFLRTSPECIPEQFQDDLKHLQEIQPIVVNLPAVAAEKEHKEEPHWPYVSWCEDSPAGYASALAGAYRTFVKADKLTDAVKDAVENVIQAAAVGKTERVLMVDGKQGTKISKALQNLGFKIEIVKCKNGKSKLTVTYE